MGSVVVEKDTNKQWLVLAVTRVRSSDSKSAPHFLVVDNKVLGLSAVEAAKLVHNLDFYKTKALIGTLTVDGDKLVQAQRIIAEYVKLHVPQKVRL